MGHRYSLPHKIIAYVMVIMLMVNLFSGSIKGRIVSAENGLDTVTLLIEKEDGSGSDSYNTSVESIIYHNTSVTIHYDFKDTYAADTVYKCIIENQQQFLGNEGDITITNEGSGNQVHHVIFQAFTADNTMIAQSTLNILLGTGNPAIRADATSSRNETEQRNEKVVTYTADKDSIYTKAYRIVEKDGNELERGDISLSAAADNEFSLTGNETFWEDGSYQIRYYLYNGTDSADIVGEDCISFVVDNIAPVVTVDTTVDADKRFEDKVIYKVTVDEINYSDCDITVMVKRETINGTDGSLTTTYRQTADKQEKEFTYEEDGIYTISVQAKDAAGNVGESEETRFVIDKTAPELIISGVESNRHYNETKKVEFSVKDLNPDPDSYTVRVKKGDGSFETKVLDWTTEGYQSKASYLVGEDGEYTVSLDAKDANSNKGRQKTISFVIDKIDPEIKIEDVEISYKDAQSGKVPVQKEETYYLDGSARLTFKVTETNWKYAEAYVNAVKTHKGISSQNNRVLTMTKNPDILSVEYEEEGIYDVDIQGKDAANNYSGVIERKFVVDKTDPVFKISGVEEGKAYQEGQMLTLEAVDDNHDLDTYKIKIEKWTKDGGYEAPEYIDAGKWSMVSGTDSVFREISFTQEGNYRVTIEGKDKAGREGEPVSVSFRIDTTAPVVTLSSVTEQGYYNEPVNLNVLIQEFNITDTDAYIHVRRVLDGEVKEDSNTRMDTANGENAFTYFYTEEGEYDVWVEVTDAAGNEGVDAAGSLIKNQRLHFVVDKTKPVLAITGAADQYMTKGTVDLTYHAADRNHDFSKYSISVVRSDLDGNEESYTDIFDAAQWEQTGYEAEKKLTYTEEGKYQITFQATDKAGNPGDKQSIVFYIDHTAPVISRITYSDVNGLIQEKYHNIYSNKAILVEFDVWDSVVGADDNRIYVSVGVPADRREGTPVYPAHKSVGNRYYVYIPTDLKVSEFDDTLTLWANDVLGNESSLVSSNVIYNTDYPGVIMNCDTDYTQWTNQDVTFHTNVSDSKSGLKEVIYRIDGKVTKKIIFDELVRTYDYDLTAAKTASKVSGYTVSVEVTNNCGTTNTMKRQVYIDKEKPKVTLSGIQKGMHYNKNQSFITNVEDVSYSKTKTVYVISRTLDGKTYTMSSPVFHSGQYSDSCTRKMIKEGKYKIYAVTTDGAGNRTTSNTISFVIDKTAPKVTVSGTEAGSMNGTPVTLNFTCEESFFATNTISVQVEKTLDGRTVSERISGFPKNKKKTAMSHTFSEDGTYKVTIMATDKAGNTAKPQTITFSVDQTKPEIRITGTGNYEQWDGPAIVRFTVEESYYSGNNVQITGTRTDIDGNVETVELPHLPNSGKTSTLVQTFKEDGIYEFEVVSKDEAGNRASSQIHFTIDQTKPQINKVGSFHGGYYQEFKLSDSMEEIFKDLTVISYRILLNGVEYNGTDTITAEGKYNLYVDVQDELGHASSENVEFIIDHTAPKVIFTGVKDGETVHESGTVTLALTNTEDEITGVRMNGADYGADTRSLSFAEYGSYQIEVDCVDKAGNAVTRSTYFVYNNPLTVLLLISGMGGLIVVTCIWLLVRTKRKEEEEKKI